MEFAFKLSIHGQRTSTRFQDLVDVTRHAEDVGFDGVYVIDHLLLPGSRLTGYTNAPADRPYFLDAWTSLAALAQATSRVRIGPQVSPVGLRHPVFLAKWAATVDHISEGRLLLQLGAGHQRVEYESYGFDFPALSERVGRLREGIEVIRALWASDEVANYEGQHYVIKDVPFWPKPVQATPSIWLGGASRSILDLVADLADGWSPAAPQGKGLTPEVFGASLRHIRSQAGTGRHVTGAALFYVIIDDSSDRIEEMLGILRRRDDWSQFTAEDFRARAIALAGSPDDVVQQIREYEKEGLEHITLAFLPLDDIEEARGSLTRVAEEVMPHFK